VPKQTSNYALYQAVPFNQPSFYPLDQTVDSTLYRAIAPWMGRLILPQPEQRPLVQGVFFEVHHAPDPYQHLVGQVVMLRWSDNSITQAFVQSVTKDVEFTQATQKSLEDGNIHAERINHWKQVDPLESLAASHPVDDMIVSLDGSVEVKEGLQGSGGAGEQGKKIPNFTRSSTILYIETTPIQITGRYYALVKVLEPGDQNDPPESLRVVHYNRESRQFDGVKEVLYFPAVQMAQTYGSYPSTTRDMAKMPPNEAGWYVYGAKNAEGQFVVQAIAPRSLLHVKPDQLLLGEKAAWDYLKHHAWKVKGQKGKTSSVLLLPFLTPETDNDEPWQEGDRALVVHTYGGIGGKHREPAAKAVLFFGHFSYGAATVVREPLADELVFDIVYYQVYTHNVDGITSCPIAFCAYMGDRQVGWMGSRPVCDVLIKHSAFTGTFLVRGATYSVLDILLQQLEQMMARYRIGDGTGGTYVSVAYNCSQDSNQAFYRALKLVRDAIRADPHLVQELQDDPGEAERYQQLLQLTLGIRDRLLPFGSARADWQNNQNTLGITPGQNVIRTILTGLQSWRTLLPRVATEAIARQFIQQKAALWVLRTNQVGGYDPDIEPIPLTRIG
jgi:predicted Abi (CAAX) family protease